MLLYFTLIPTDLEIFNFIVLLKIEASKIVGIASTLENPQKCSGFLGVSAKFAKKRVLSIIE